MDGAPAVDEEAEGGGGVASVAKHRSQGSLITAAAERPVVEIGRKNGTYGKRMRVGCACRYDLCDCFFAGAMLTWSRCIQRSIRSRAQSASYQRHKQEEVA